MSWEPGEKQNANQEKTEPLPLWNHSLARGERQQAINIILSKLWYVRKVVKYPAGEGIRSADKEWQLSISNRALLGCF